MSFVSEKSKATPRSVIREMFAMQTGLDNLVSFALGEPDFTTPTHIIEAAAESFHRGETHYTPNAGIPALREAIARSYQERGLDYRPEEILVGAGAISVLCLACTAGCRRRTGSCTTWRTSGPPSRPGRSSLC